MISTILSSNSFVQLLTFLSAPFTHNHASLPTVLMALIRMRAPPRPPRPFTLSLMMTLRKRNSLLLSASAQLCTTSQVQIKRFNIATEEQHKYSEHSHVSGFIYYLYIQGILGREVYFSSSFEVVKIAVWYTVSRETDFLEQQLKQRVSEAVGV